MSALYGMRVITSPLCANVQTIKLRAGAPVSDAFRRDFDAWLLETFGVHDVVYIIGDSILVSPKTSAALQLSRTTP